MQSATIDVPAIAADVIDITTKNARIRATGGLEARITKDTVRDLFAAGVLNKVAYIALILRLDQPIDGTIQEIDPEIFAEEITFETALAGGKDKTYSVSPADVEVAIATLQKKGCLQCDKPPVQLTIGLHY
jgi:hypothetical protein